jgi:hypothetical protein
MSHKQNLLQKQTSINSKISKMTREPEGKTLQKEASMVKLESLLNPSFGKQSRLKHSLRESIAKEPNLAYL